MIVDLLLWTTYAFGVVIGATIVCIMTYWKELNTRQALSIIMLTATLFGAALYVHSAHTSCHSADVVARHGDPMTAIAAEIIGEEQCQLGSRFHVLTHVMTDEELRSALYDTGKIPPYHLDNAVEYVRNLYGVHGE